MKKPGIWLLPSTSGNVLELRSAVELGADLSAAQTEREM